MTYAARRIGAIADIVEINLDHIQILSPTVRFLKRLSQELISCLSRLPAVNYYNSRTTTALPERIVKSLGQVHKFRPPPETWGLLPYFLPSSCAFKSAKGLWVADFFSVLLVLP